MINTAGLQSKVEFQSIANKAPQGGATVKTKDNCELSVAEQIARDDETINFFYIDQQKTAHFYSGQYDSLQDQAGTTTYLVKEIYDMHHTATANSLLKQVRAGISKNNPFDVSSATAEKPLEIHVGIIFCDFKDVHGETAISTLREKLIGGSLGSNKLADFVHNESNQKVKIIVEGLPENANNTWLRLPKNHTDYENNKYLNVMRDVDKKIDYPNSWKVVIYAFPDKIQTGAPADIEYDKDGNWLGISVCHGAHIVDKDPKAKKSQSIQQIFIDPNKYTDTSLHKTVIHEVMHALSLLDLYYIPAYRSFGWSVMSVAFASQHLLQLEKWILSWNKLNSVIFLKRGIIDIELISKGEGTKVLIMMPDEKVGRKDLYFMEVAQDIGKTQNDVKKFKKDNSKDYGILLMMIDHNKKDGIISPFVSKRPIDPTAGSKYASASKAPYKSGQSFQTMGLFSQKIEANEPNQIQCIVGINRGYKAVDQANYLRENECITDGKQSFGLSTLGIPSFEGYPCFDQKGTFVPLGLVDLKLNKNGYGYYLHVDNHGQVHFKTSIDLNGNRKTIQSFPVPEGLELTQGEYSLKIESEDNNTCLSVFKGDQRQYILWRKAKSKMKQEVTCGTDQYYLDYYGVVYKWKNNKWNSVGVSVKSMVCFKKSLYIDLGNGAVLEKNPAGGWHPQIPLDALIKRKMSVQNLLDLGFSPATLIAKDSINKNDLLGASYQGGLIFEIRDNGKYGKICYPEDLSSSNWDHAQEKCTNLGLWRIPSKDEVTKMIEVLQPNHQIFKGDRYYWTSTEGGAIGDVYISLYTGQQWPSNKTGEAYTRAVSEFGEAVILRKTDRFKQSFICNGKILGLEQSGTLYQFLNGQWKEGGRNVRSIKCFQGTMYGYLGGTTILKYAKPNDWSNDTIENLHEAGMTVQDFLDFSITPQIIFQTGIVQKEAFLGMVYNDGYIFEINDDCSHGKICYTLGIPSLNWADSMAYCQNLRPWRMASKEEIKSMTESIQSICELFKSDRYYWCSTEADDATQAYISLFHGQQWPSPKTGLAYAKAVQDF